MQNLVFIVSSLRRAARSGSYQKCGVFRQYFSLVRPKRVKLDRVGSKNPFRSYRGVPDGLFSKGKADTEKNCTEEHQEGLWSIIPVFQHREVYNRDLRDVLNKAELSWQTLALHVSPGHYRNGYFSPCSCVLGPIFERKSGSYFQLGEDCRPAMETEREG